MYITDFHFFIKAHETKQMQAEEKESATWMHLNTWTFSVLISINCRYTITAQYAARQTLKISRSQHTLKTTSSHI